MKAIDVTCPECRQRTRVEIPTHEPIRCPACQAVLPAPPPEEELLIPLAPLDPAPTAAASPAGEDRAPTPPPRRRPRPRPRQEEEEAPPPREPWLDAELKRLLAFAAAGIVVAGLTLWLQRLPALAGWRPAILLLGSGGALVLFYLAVTGLTGRAQRARVREYEKILAQAQEDTRRMEQARRRARRDRHEDAS